MLSKDNTGLIVVDVQGKLATLMHESDVLIENITKLVKGAKALKLPVLWLEQNPERLGLTADPIREVLEKTIYQSLNIPLMAAKKRDFS